MLEKIGKYEVRLQLGRGGMGIVYEGFDPAIERRVAIKTLRTEAIEPDQLQEFLARFRREARSAGRLSHPHIVTIYEYGEQDGMPYIVMEYIAGRDLSVDLKRGVRFALDDVVRMMTQLLSALAHAHENGIVHRDIKPQNILLLDDGTLKVVDFGIARIEEADSFTKSGMVIGTPAYMAPEQILGLPATARSDIFSVGTLLYQLLTGDRPFTGDEFSVKQKVLKMDPIRPSELNPMLGPPWDAVVLRAMAKKPEARYDSARQFLEAIKAALVADQQDADAQRRKSIEEEEHARRAAEERSTEEARKRQEAARREIERNEREEATQQQPETRERLPAGGIGRWVATGLVMALLGGGAWYFRQGTEDQGLKADVAWVAAESLAKEESGKRERAEALAREEAERRAKLEGEVKRQAELAEKARLEEEARKSADEQSRSLALKMEEAERKKAELAAKKVADAKKLAEADAKARAEAESQRLAEISAKRRTEDKAKVDEEAKVEAARKDAEAKAALRKPGAVFRDCPECPQMVVIPAGEFTMGSPATELDRTTEEGPQRMVRIERPFAIARTEITVAQFGRFVQATKWNARGCSFWDGRKFLFEVDRNWEMPKYPQGKDHPVVCVSWLDATVFVDWLSLETGKRYRLPTEAEWEYAARAGTRSSRFWGDRPAEACAFANVYDRSARQSFPQMEFHECDDGHVYTAPVGSRRPNPFGLHDMLGNVWELTEDCWNANYIGAPVNGSAWIVGDCSRRVIRGGGWIFGPSQVRAAVRSSISVRNFHVGFRIARTLE